MINRNLYTYKVHGLLVKSEIELSELIPFIMENGKECDVIVSIGTVTKVIEGAVISNDTFKLSKTELYFFIEGIAHYYIGHGNSIIIEPVHDFQLIKLKYFLFGGCFGALLTQRNTIGLHGSSVLVNGKGIVIIGRSGAGKSTLVASLVKEGNAFLSDDISALVTDDDGNNYINPAYPQQKMSKDALERMGYNTDFLNLVDPVRDKYLIPVIHDFMNSKVLLSAIFELCVNYDNEAKINKINGYEKVKIIYNNIYSYGIIQQTGDSPVFFKKCMIIAQNTPIYKITRPVIGLTIKDITKLIRDVMS